MHSARLLAIAWPLLAVACSSGATVDAGGDVTHGSDVTSADGGFDAMDSSPDASAEAGDDATIDVVGPSDDVRDDRAFDARRDVAPMGDAGARSDRVGIALPVAIWNPPHVLETFLDTIATRTHVGWIRTGAQWSSIEQTRGTYSFTATDRFVTETRARGIHAVLNLAYAPAWARPAGVDAAASSTDNFAPAPAHVADFGRFCGAVAARYAPMGVMHYEVWNEPNLALFFQPSPDPALYGELLRACGTAIHAAAPGAVVIAGAFAAFANDSTAGGNPNNAHLGAPGFLRALYAAGVMNQADAVSTHPYSYPNLPTDPGATNGFSGVTPVLRQVMDLNGDTAKAIWGTEFGAPTCTACSGGGVTPMRQAQIFTVGWMAWNAMRTPTGPLFLYTWSDDTLRDGTSPDDVRDLHFGVVFPDGGMKQPGFDTFAALR